MMISLVEKGEFDAVFKYVKWRDKKSSIMYNLQ